MEQIAVASFVAAAICLIEKVRRALAVGEGRRCEEGCPFLPDEGGVNFAIMRGIVWQDVKKHFWQSSADIQRIGGHLRGVGSGAVASVGGRERQ
jgi:hypothetical protein